MTHYVLTRSDLHGLPAHTVGRVVQQDAARCEVVVAFNDQTVTLAAEAAVRWLAPLRPIAWKAVLVGLDRSRRRTVLPADPRTYDPPQEWHVPASPRFSLTPPSDEPTRLAVDLDVRLFRRDCIPAGSDTWIYREERRPA